MGAPDAPVAAAAGTSGVSGGSGASSEAATMPSCPRYAGTTGSTQGDRKLTSPAKRAAPSVRSTRTRPRRASASAPVEERAQPRRGDDEVELVTARSRRPGCAGRSAPRARRTSAMSTRSTVGIGRPAAARTRQLVVEEVLGLVADAAAVASIERQRHSRGAVVHGVADSRPRYDSTLRPRSSVDRAAPS